MLKFLNYIRYKNDYEYTDLVSPTAYDRHTYAVYLNHKLKKAYQIGNNCLYWIDYNAYKAEKAFVYIKSKTN